MGDKPFLTKGIAYQLPVWNRAPQTLSRSEPVVADDRIAAAVLLRSGRGVSKRGSLGRAVDSREPPLTTESEETIMIVKLLASLSGRT